MEDAWCSAYVRAVGDLNWKSCSIAGFGWNLGSGVESQLRWDSKCCALDQTAALNERQVFGTWFKAARIYFSQIGTDSIRE